MTFRRPFWDLQPNFSHLKEGGYYLTRRGNLVGDVHSGFEVLYPFQGRLMSALVGEPTERWLSWAVDGSYDANNPHKNMLDLAWEIATPRQWKPVAYRKPVLGDLWLPCTPTEPSIEYCVLHKDPGIYGNCVIVTALEFGSEPALATDVVMAADVWDMI